MTTWRMADGTLIAGEYSFTTTPEFFDDEDDPVRVVREVWSLTESVESWQHPTTCIHLSADCSGDGEIEGDTCPTCAGDGDATCEQWEAAQ